MRRHARRLGLCAFAPLRLCPPGRLGEDRIRFYHRQDEGFSSRKPLDPRDLGPGDTIQ
jgi:hypothetical protein